MDKLTNFTKEIYFAGGCFWGIQKYLSNINGVISTDVGYANGNTKNPTYEDVINKKTGYVETVHVIYDKNEIKLNELIEIFFEAIDPTSLNRQGNDIGDNYRTGIYYIDNLDISIIENTIKNLQNKYTKKIVTEVTQLQSYYIAEDYHQDYLDKNVNGYCHITKEKIEFAKNANSKKKFDLSKLSELEYQVTQNSKTEPAFNNKYHDNFTEGIYVDIVSGTPLFLSTDKFESHCGWPSFSKPIDSNNITSNKDLSYGMVRTEIRSKISDSHLGHIFNDGPTKLGGKRYCINSASLRFISKQDMEKEGYKEYIKYLENG